ncbi:uncharacterized protein UDID_19124 [Ustilago sp. UG-2017a]|nr:uncharacterized protein UDID_19124 [Ustilago sp. UG-2017a]
MTTSTDDSLDISAQLFQQSTTPTSSATQTESVPALSQSGSTSAPDIHTSCPTRASRSATGKKNFTWSGADVLHLVTILYNSASVKPNCIKAKLRWLQETYYREKKKLSLTGAGTLLEDIASNPSYISCLALSTKYTCLNFTSNDEADMPSYSSADIPMDLSGTAVASTSGASVAGAGDDDFFTMPSPLQAQPSFSMAGGLDVFDSTSSHSSAQHSPGTKRK